MSIDNVGNWQRKPDNPYGDRQNTALALANMSRLEKDHHKSVKPNQSHEIRGT